MHVRIFPAAARYPARGDRRSPCTASSARSRARTTRPSRRRSRSEAGVTVEPLRETPLAELPAVVAGPPALLFVCGLPYTRMRDARRARSSRSPHRCRRTRTARGTAPTCWWRRACGRRRPSSCAARASASTATTRSRAGCCRATRCASSASTRTATTGCAPAATATRCARSCAARWRRRRSTPPCSRSSCAPTPRWAR